MELPFSSAPSLKFPQLNGEISSRGPRLPIHSVRRCSRLRYMGQWVVSVLGLEPLHLRVTLAKRMRWLQGYLTARPRPRRRGGSAAGRRQVHERAVLYCAAGAHARARVPRQNSFTISARIACTVRGRPGARRGYAQRRRTRLACQRSRVCRSKIGSVS
jgi:hypothetical protein